jgi:hypothetical protein
MSPTLITPAMTQVGLILGTAKAESRTGARQGSDKRSDIWAFGAVLFGDGVGSAGVRATAYRRHSQR